MRASAKGKRLRQKRRFLGRGNQGTGLAEGQACTAQVAAFEAHCVGDYRVIHTIQDHVTLVVVVNMGLCRDLYQK